MAEKNTETKIVPLGRHGRRQELKSTPYRWLALVLAAVLLFVVAVGGVGLLRLRNNVTTAELNLGELGGNLADGALDVLVIGSDTRLGENAHYGDESDQASAARSDVMMLVQVSADRQNVSVISFPRDLMVTIPKCTDAESGVVYPQTPDTQINESLSRGGPGCTVATISSITGVKIDHFMLVDFNAVKELSEVVGGVEVCVTSEIDDSYSGLKLPAGTSTVQGEQALAFLRSRHGFGDGSDTGRIQAQQGFLSALLRKVQGEGTLSNPSQLMKIAEAITQNVTVDSGLTNLGTLVQMGSIFGGVDLGNVVFATVPNEPYVYDANKLQVAASASELFSVLQADRSLKEPVPAPSVSSEAPAEEPEVVLDRNLAIDIYAAGAETDAVGGAVSTVEELGYVTVTQSENSVQYTESMIYYPYGFEAEAQEIADKLGIKSLTPSEIYTLEVYLATDFGVEQEAPAQEAAIAGGASGQTADKATCQVSFGG